MNKSKLTLYIFIGLTLGILTGWIFPAFGASLKPLADIFLRMIKMIIAPLILSTLVVGIAGHDNFKALGRTSLKTIVYFEIVTTIALVIGLATANYFNVGAGVNLNVSEAGMNEVSKLAAVQQHTSFADTFTHIVPTSVVDAMARGDILQVVVFAIFFAIAIAMIGDKGKPVLNFLSSLAEVMFKFTEIVMMFAPVGVFAAIASSVGNNGIEILGVYAKLIFATYFALALFVCSVLMIACKMINIPFFGLVKALQAPTLLAFSTASSEAALPKAMEIMEKFGVPRKIVSFVMPTGYTFNLDGSTLYLSLATIFIAQASGIELSLSQQLMIMLTLMLTSKGIAGVPRVSLVILTGTLISFNIPVAGVAILLGIDQILDMGRTTVNLIGNCVATAVIARWENCFDYNKMKKFIAKSGNSELLEPLKPPVKDILTSHTTSKTKQEEDLTIY